MTDSAGRRVLAINMFSMRPGISPDRFADFSANLDQPTVLAHSEVVSRFDVFRVQAGQSGAPLGVDIVEIMEVSSWAAWEDVRDRDPSLVPVMTGFDQLVDPASVRSSLVVPILRGR
jgi:hypothetical protein